MLWVYAAHGQHIDASRVPRHNLERYDRRGFSVTAPRPWNDLPDRLSLIDSLELFKSNLKAHLFKAAFVNYL